MFNKRVNKDDKDKHSFKKRLKLIIIISALSSLVIVLAGFIFLYIKLSDKNRNTYKERELEVAEIINKNYIDGLKDISTSGQFSFSLPEEDVNELLSIASKSLNDKHIESIYYKVAENKHHYFYFDLKKVPFKTRVVVDTVSSVDLENNCFYLAIQKCDIGQLSAFHYLTKKGYISNEFVSKVATHANLPISYDKKTNSIKYEPLKYIDLFRKGDIADLVFDSVKKERSAITLVENDLSFNINFTKFRNADYVEVNSSTPVVDVYNKVKSSLEALDSSSLTKNVPYVVDSLSELELTRIINNSFIEVKDEDVTSSLTLNKAKYKVSGVNISFISDKLIRLSLNVNINEYIININVDAEIYSLEGDFETYFYFKEEISVGICKYIGSTDQYVSKVISILNVIFMNVSLNQTKSFTSNPSADQFGIYLNNISSELSDISLQACPKQIRINPVSHVLEFVITIMI